jgi:hypothetical protein
VSHISKDLQLNATLRQGLSILLLQHYAARFQHGTCSLLSAGSRMHNDREIDLQKTRRNRASIRKSCAAVLFQLLLQVFSRSLLADGLI